MFRNLTPYTDIHEMNLDWIIAKVKEYISKYDILEIDFENLKNYVDNYFDNLDVQNEINNKLDEMYESGELSDIIQEYLQVSSLLTYNTIADLKNAENLIDGVDALCLGQNTYLDGFTNLFKIRTLTSSDVIDEITIFALTNYPTLIAEKLPTFKNIYDELDVLNNAKNLHVRPDENAFYYHFNALTGDDSNDGLTTETPFKTLQPIFNILNSSIDGLNDLRINLDADGVYEIPFANISGCVMHIYGQSENTILDFTTQYDPTLYNCHINIRDCFIRTHNDDYGFKLDGCNFLLTRVKFNEKLRIHASTGSMVGCTDINRIEGLYSNIYFNGITFKNTDTSKNAMNFTNCYVGCQGSITNIALSENSTTNAFLNARSSTITGNMTLLNAQNGKYYNGLVCTNSNILMAQAYITAMQTRSVDGNVFTNNATGLISEIRGATPIRLTSQMVRYNESSNKLEYWNESTQTWTTIAL